MPMAGSPVPPELKPAPFTPPSPASEPMILAVLPQITKPKFGLADSFTMIFTRDWLILAKLSNAVMKDVIQQSQAASKAAGKGWMGKVGDQMKAFYSAHLRYYNMDPEAILVEDKDNFVIPHVTVNSLKIKTKLSGGDDDGPGDESLELEFDTSGGKYKFNCANASKETRALFTNYYGPKIRY